MSATPDTPERERIALEEAGLAQAAAAGDGAAFAELYDRYEKRIFNFCLRIVGTPEDAADATQETFLSVFSRLRQRDAPVRNFAAYLYTVARHASATVLDRRRRVEPVDALPESGAASVTAPGGDRIGLPEEATLLSSFQADVRAASGRLPQRQREALALRELEELSYDEIAVVMGMNRNSVAQLLSRARITLGRHLRSGALGSIASSSPDCERARPLISMRDDGEPLDIGSQAFLADHLAACASCRLSEQAMHEAGAAYAGLLPVAAVVGLREAVLAQAGGVLGFSGAAAGAGAGGAAAGGAGAGAAGGAGAGGGGGGSGAAAGASGAGRGRWIAVAATSAVVAAAIAYAALNNGGSSDKAPTPTVATTPAVTPTPKPKPKSKPKPKPKPRRAQATKPSPTLQSGYAGVGGSVQLDVGGKQVASGGGSSGGGSSGGGSSGGGSSGGGSSGGGAQTGGAAGGAPTTSVASGASSSRDAKASEGSLPVTGLELALVLLAGMLLVVLGALLRRLSVARR